VSQISVRVSAFRLCVSAEGFQPCTWTLPTCVRVSNAVALCGGQGVVRVRLPVDTAPLEAGPDPGSPQWVLANALERAPESGQLPVDSAQAELQEQTKDAAARFHLNAPSTTNAGTTSTTMKCTDPEPMELPEDKFHKRCYLSQHIIEQREAGKAQNKERSTKERRVRLTVA
jgi:hypothetical protein